MPGDFRVVDQPPQDFRYRMTLIELKTHFGYQRWATRQLLDKAATLTEEELKRDLHSSYKSILDTLNHLYRSEWVWYQRTQGISPASFDDILPATELPELVFAYQDVQADWQNWANSLIKEDLDSELSYRLLNGTPVVSKLWQVVFHVVNHSTYHRGQVTTMLRQLGKTPVALDLIHYYRQLTN